MFCGTCGSLLPDGAAVCPQCGNANVASKSFSPEATSSADRLNGHLAQHVPVTNYGAGQNPYAVPSPPPPPYSMNPYDATVRASYTPTPMPPPHMLPPSSYPSPQPLVQSRKRGSRLFLIIGGILVACLVLCGALVYFTSVLANTGNQQRQADATPTSQASPTAQPGPAADQNPYPPQTGTLIMSDPMHDNSKGYKWDEATMNGKGGTGFCGYKQGNYHVTESSVPASSQAAIICNPEAPQLNLSNEAFEVNMTVSKGTGVGLAVRLDQTKGTGYLFKVFTNGQYAIGTADLNNTDANKQFVSIRTGTNGAIKQGLNQSNLLAIVANGTTISLFMNGQFIDGVQDSSFTKGQPGVRAFSNGDLDATAQNARMWRI